MIVKTIEIDEKQVEFRASAAVPRLYRFKFRRDIIRDMMKLKEAFVANQTKGKEFDVIDLELFENIAYIMAKHADKNVPDSVEEWLDSFNMFSIYEVGLMVAILEKRLSSEVGFKGIFKKVLIFSLVAVANIIDTQFIKTGGTIRTATVFFYVRPDRALLTAN